MSPEKKIGNKKEKQLLFSLPVPKRFKTVSAGLSSQRVALRRLIIRLSARSRGRRGISKNGEEIPMTFFCKIIQKLHASTL